MRPYISIILGFLAVTPAASQTAPETLAYLLFGISVPPKILTNHRTDILKTTPTALQFARFYTGENNQYNSEENNITIEQNSSCNFRVTGKLRLGDDFISMDNTLDFTGMSGSEPKFVTKKAASQWQLDRYYYKIEGIKACARKGSFKAKDAYHQFPAENQCGDHIYTANMVDDADVKRMDAAYLYFKQAYCKGRAF